MRRDRIPTLLDVIGREAEQAADRYGPPTSTHEAFGVLSEEVAELFEAIRRNDLSDIRNEAVQVSAVALRLAVACDQAIDGYDPTFARRSGGA